MRVLLVLSRKVRQRVSVGGIVGVTVLGIRDGVVRLGFEAPKTIRICRQELLEQRRAEQAKNDND